MPNGINFLLPEPVPPTLFLLSLNGPPNLELFIVFIFFATFQNNLLRNLPSNICPNWANFSLSTLPPSISPIWYPYFLLHLFSPFLHHSRKFLLFIFLHKKKWGLLNILREILLKNIFKEYSGIFPFPNSFLCSVLFLPFSYNIIF